MIISSIDLMDQQVVQLIGGAEKAIEAGDAKPIAEKFRTVGEIAVIDLDAALGRGSNASCVHEVLNITPCRVGGGIRDVERARYWLDAGASHVILGTAATPEILKQLPRERVIAALDTRHGEVVDHGWTHATGKNVFSRMQELKPYVSGFLVTFVEREGKLQGIDLEQVKALVQAAGECRLTVAGGVTTPEDVACIDQLGADAQVGMALYTGRFSQADALIAMLQTDRADGTYPTVVTNELGVALGLAYSNAESLRAAIDEKRGIYWSRKRGLWRKGATSGDEQELLRVDVDCDRDALRFVVKQKGRGFCHLSTDTCWGNYNGMHALEKTLQLRMQKSEDNSYAQRLFSDPTLLAQKIIEEAKELTEAKESKDIMHEISDVIFFTMVKMIQSGLSLHDIATLFDKRALKVTRRPGHAKVSPEEST